VFGKFEEFQKLVEIRRLAQKAQCAGLAGGLARRGVIICGNEDNGRGIALISQLLLQLQSRHAKHRDIEQDTIFHVRSAVGQEVVRRNECLRFVGKRGQERRH
jgi:hypothetical protein